MSLVVENGTGLVNAESYGSVAEADAYHLGIGNTAWTGIQDQSTKEQLLRQGFKFLERYYRPRWKGWRSTTVQASDWPRLGVTVDDIAAYPTGGHLSSFSYMIAANVIPQQVKDAQFELALLANDGPLVPPTLKQGRTRVKVGPIDIAYDKQTPQSPRYPTITRILSPLLEETGGMIKLAR